MSDHPGHHWLLVRNTEDGTRLRWLDEAALARLLACPGESGILRFCDPQDININPAYWDRSVAVLMRVEVVIPEQVEAYRLPEWVLNP
jgi:hypothetical protein